MYCKHCGEIIDDDSTYCCKCGKKVVPQNEPSKRVRVSSVSDNDGKKIVRNGETLTIRNGILFDEDGWDVGRVPPGYTPGWGDPL
mgnify:CR=1 FL=1